WKAAATAGPEPCLRPEDGDTEVPVGERLVLVLRGPALPASDRRVLTAFAIQAAVALEQQRLSDAAAAMKPLADADRLRTSLLAAVGHDLRTPLASAKAAVTSLRGTDVEWTPDERTELLATADESLDRLARLVDNILDVSRLQAGVLPVAPRAFGLEEVLPLAIDELGPDGAQVVMDVPPSLPEVHADPVLVERVVANLLANAVRYAPPGQPPFVTASALGDRVEIRVVDRGPGIPAQHRERVFAPFQRLGDHDNTAGLGLGLSLSRGLTEAMGGTLTLEDTPGGGLTMVVALPVAPLPPPATPPPPPPPTNVRDD
ncbi:MAG TPA: ATP-binding protein, partial [Actinomycetes bacterium]